MGKIKKAVSKVVSAVKSTYTKADTALGGYLPGAVAPKSSTPAPAPKTPAKSPSALTGTVFDPNLPFGNQLPASYQKAPTTPKSSGGTSTAPLQVQAPTSTTSGAIAAPLAAPAPTSSGSYGGSNIATGTFLDPNNPIINNPVGKAIGSVYDKLTSPDPRMGNVAPLDLMGGGFVTKGAKVATALERNAANLQKAITKLEGLGVNLVDEFTLPAKVAQAANGVVKIGDDVYKAGKVGLNTVTFKKQNTILKTIVAKAKSPTVVLGLLAAFAGAAGSAYLFGRQMVPNEMSDAVASLKRGIEQAERAGDKETAQALYDQLKDTRDAAHNLTLIDSMNYPGAAINRIDAELSVADAALKRLQEAEDKALADQEAYEQRQLAFDAERDKARQERQLEFDITRDKASQERRMSQMEQEAEFRRNQIEDEAELRRLEEAKGREEAAAFWRAFQAEKEGGFLRPGLTFAQWNKGRSSLGFGILGGQSE